MNISPENNMERNYLYVCRCCSKEDGYIDIFTGLPRPESTATCEQMLKSTFDIKITHHPTLAKSLICASCINILQRAASFKQMVLNSEVTFTQWLENSKDVFKVIKEEEVFEDYGDSGDENEVLANIKSDLEILEDGPLKRQQCKIERKSKSKRCKVKEDQETGNIYLDSLTNEELRRRYICAAHFLPSDIHIGIRSRLIGPAVPIHFTQVGGETSAQSDEHSDAIMEDEINVQLQKDWSKIAERRGMGPLLRENSLKLIQNSNLCVFQWNKSRYRCFCCNTPFSDINLLKSHTFTEHTIENIEKKIILQQNRLVKVETTNLECKLCRNSFDGIPNLIQHLKIHGVEIVDHLLVPFRIEEELVCQICLKKFAVFRLLNIHINKHYQKQVCHICGAGFSNLVFLNLHKTRSHKLFDCKPCNLIFNSRIDKKHHDMAAHGIKYERKLRFPCTFCPERFFQENFKVKHMVENHGLPKPDFKCNICSKTFLTRSLCNNHVKNVHNKEKNKECDICHMFFYTKSDVARHKVTHTGEKKFSCVVCTNLFASKDSLRRHMKRSHVGVQ